MIQDSNCLYCELNIDAHCMELSSYWKAVNLICLVDSIPICYMETTNILVHELIYIVINLLTYYDSFISPFTTKTFTWFRISYP